MGLPPWSLPKPAQGRQTNASVPLWFWVCCLQGLVSVLELCFWKSCHYYLLLYAILCVYRAVGTQKCTTQLGRPSHTYFCEWNLQKYLLRNFFWGSSSLLGSNVLIPETERLRSTCWSGDAEYWWGVAQRFHGMVSHKLWPRPFQKVTLNKASQRVFCRLHVSGKMPTRRENLKEPGRNIMGIHGVVIAWSCSTVRLS